MLCRCQGCTDQQNTIKLLCDQVLRKDLFDLVNSFNRCEKCDENINMKMFRETFNSVYWSILHYNRRMQKIKEEINDKNINKHINKESMGYIRYVGHCLTYGHKPLDRYRIEAENEIKKMIQKRKNRKVGDSERSSLSGRSRDDDLNLNIVAYNFFCNIFLKSFGNEKGQKINNILYKILFL